MTCTGDCGEAPRFTVVDLDKLARRIGQYDSSLVFWAKHRIERLEIRADEDNSVCVCGCPHEDHESLDDDGEQCSEGHTCLRVAPAIRDLYVEMRERAKKAERERDEALKRISELPSQDHLVALRHDRDRLAINLASAEHNIRGLEEFQELRRACMSDLTARRDELKRELRAKDLILHEKNMWLDALGHVWCSGGCNGGTGKYSGITMTEEGVAYLERNAVRARKWLRAYQCKHNRGHTEACSGCASFGECEQIAKEQK